MKPIPNVTTCYEHQTGAIREDDERAFMDWCEAKVNEWNAIAIDEGYVVPIFKIKTVFGDITYHEWLAHEVGL